MERSKYFKAGMWFLKRPRLYLQLLRNLKTVILGQYLSKDTAECKREAALWCKELAVDTAEALSRITGSAAYDPIKDKFKDVFTVAEEVATNCPVTMGDAGNIDLLYSVCEHLQAETVIETGVAYGWSSLALLLSLSHRANGQLISTDMPYINQDSDQYVGCVVPDDLKSRWQLIRLADRDALPKILKKCQSIDMCHYDSDKTYQGRMWAYPRLWKALRPKGVFLSDDVADNLGFRDFSQQVNAEPIIVAMPVRTRIQYIGVIVKNGV